MRQILAGLVVAVVVTSACVSAGNGRHVDYIDIVSFGGITYRAVWTSPGRPIQDSELGHVFAHLRYSGGAHLMEGGSATYLPAGAAVYRLKVTAPPSGSSPGRQIG